MTDRKPGESNVYLRRLKKSPHEIIESTNYAIALWEHTSSCGIKRIETALVPIDMSVDNLHHIQAALDAQYGGGGHSQIIIKRALLITEGLKEKGAE